MSAGASASALPGLRVGSRDAGQGCHPEGRGAVEVSRKQKYEKRETRGCVLTDFEAAASGTAAEIQYFSL